MAEAASVAVQRLGIVGGLVVAGIRMMHRMVGMRDMIADCMVRLRDMVPIRLQGMLAEWHGDRRYRLQR